MRASVLLLLIVSTLVVSEVEGWKWGKKVWGKIKTTAKKVVDVAKKVSHIIGKRSAEVTLTANQEKEIEDTCQQMIDSGEISATSDAQDFLKDIMADCNDNPECVNDAMGIIEACISMAQEEIDVAL